MKDTTFVKNQNIFWWNASKKYPFHCFLLSDCVFLQVCPTTIEQSEMDSSEKDDLIVCIADVSGRIRSSFTQMKKPESRREFIAESPSIVKDCCRTTELNYVTDMVPDESQDGNWTPTHKRDILSRVSEITINGSSQLEGFKTKNSSCRAFICKLCSKSFQWLSTLKLHERSHKRDTPFTCKFCAKS